MALKVEIKSTDIAERKGTNAKGVPYHIRSQDGYITTFLSDGREQPYPERFSLNLEADQAPYPVGFYELPTDECTYVGDYGRLMLGRPRLVPAKQGVKAVA